MKTDTTKLLEWALSVCNNIQSIKTYGNRFPETASLGAAIEEHLNAPQPASEQGEGYPIYGGDGLHEGPSGSPNPIQPKPEPTDFREKVKEIIKEAAS